jgi:predicted DNA-binding transcriptional regulator AlpA
MPSTTPETQTQRALLNLEEAAKFFRVSRTTFYELRKSPKFPTPIRIMGKTLFLAEDLMNYALSRKVEKRC